MPIDVGPAFKAQRTAKAECSRQKGTCLRGQCHRSRMSREGAHRSGPFRLGKGFWIRPWARWEAMGCFTAEERLD